MNDYEYDVQIDPEGLDMEWLDQPALMMRYSSAAAQARKEADEAKEAFELCKAEIDLRIRKNPDAFDLPKVTESCVTSATVVQPEYKQAAQALIDAKYEAEMARAAVAAIEQRRSALENLVKLHGASYFAGPKVPHELTNQNAEDFREQLAAKRTKDVNSKVGQAMRG